MAPGSVWASAVRQDQVRQLVQFVQEGAPRRDPVIVCGDFNAGPDSDEIRMLTGGAATVAPGKVFYDSWEIAGDSSAGCTWSNPTRSPPSAYTRTAAPQESAVSGSTACQRPVPTACGDASA